MWYREKQDALVLHVRVQPNSSREGIAGIKNDALLIRLNAPPVEGRANEALVRFLSKRLGVPKSRLSIMQGEKGRNKLVAVQGLTADRAAALLEISL